MRKRNTHGFTLVELAIVIVIAGILAAVAIPIYQGIVEKSKWSEGKANCGLINAAYKVVKAEESGQLPNLSAGPVPYAQLDLNATEFDSDTFTSASYDVPTLDSLAGNYEIRCSGTLGVPQGGPYVIDQDGVVVNDAP